MAVGEIGGISVKLKAEIDDAAVGAAAQRITSNVKKIEKSFEDAGLSAKSSMKVFSSALDSTQTALKAFIQQQVAAGRTIDENGNVITAYGVKAKGLTDTFKRLSQEYENNRRIANKTSDVMSGIEKNIRSLDFAAEEAKDDIAALSAELAKYNVRQTDFIGPMRQNESASRNLSSAFKMQKGSMAQLGMQIQDVAVMSQYGADKFVILGTQGSQIASLFGPGGAVFGAVLAIAAAIGGTLVNSINAAKDASSELPKELMTRLDNIKARFEEVDEASRSAFLRVEFDKINAEYDKYQERIDRARDTLVKMGPQAGVAYAKQAQHIDNLVAKQKELADMMDKISRMSVESIDFSGIDLSIDGGDAGVQSRVEAVKNGIEKERELYEAWRQTKAAITSGIITDEQAQLIQADIAEQQRINTKFDNTMARLEEERKLLAENQVLSAEEKAARQAEIDAAELAADRLHKEQLSQQAIEYATKTAKAIENIEKTKSRTIQQLERATWSAAAGFLDQFAGESKAAAIASIAINKGLSLAQAAQNTAVGVMRAYTVDPTGALGAKVAAMGKIQMGLIAATGLAQAAGAVKGNNSANTFSAGVPAVNTTNGGGSSSQSVNRTFDIRGLNPSDMVSGQQVYDLLKALSGDGYDFNFIGG